MRFVFGLALLGASCSASPATAPKATASPQAAAIAYPALTGRVVHNAHLLGPADKSKLEGELLAAQRKTRHQLVVVTVPSLGGRAIEDFGVGLGRHWGIGRKGVNDGVLLIVAPNERKVRIEVGYGLEAVLRDDEASRIIQQQILPRFRSKDFSGGIEEGTTAILHEIDVPGATP